MRRAEPISVRVRAPSRGLVTRLPHESADLYRPSDLKRTATDAQNVRYEDGVIKNAPGFSAAKFLTSVSTSVLAHWRMDDASLPGTRVDATSNHYDLVPSVVIISGNVSSDGLGNYIFTAGSAHGLASGDVVTVAGLILQAEGNGRFVITVTGSTTFAYTSRPSGSTVTESCIATANILDISAVFQDAGKIKKAIHWEGIPSPYATLQSTIPNVFGGSFSVGFWINEDNVGDGLPIFKAPGFQAINGAGVITFQVWNGTSVISVNTPGSISSATWYYVSLVYDNSAHTITAYLNTTASSPVSTTTGLATHFSSVFTMGNAGYLSGFLVDSMTVWNRAISSGEVTTLYNGGTGTDWPFFSGVFSLLYQANLIGSLPTPLIGAAGKQVYFLDRSFVSNVFYLTPTQLYSGSAPSTGYPWTATDFFDTVILAQHDNPAQYWTAPLPNVCQVVPGLPSNDDQWDGAEAFFGHVLLWKDDRLKWSDRDDFTNWIPVAQTASSAVLTINTGGFVQPAVGATVAIPVTTDPVTAGIVVGQFIFIQDNRGTGTANQFYNYYQVTAVSGSPTDTITARLLDLTGHTTTGLTIAAGQQVFTVDANEAGETRVVGSKMNGKIFKIVAMGDYAYIFKERSVQSIQYVGLESGTFFIHPEISDEGALSRTAVLNLGDGRIVFLGHKELYLYTGGPAPQPIATQVTRQVLREIDRTRLHEIVMVHKEILHEVWVSYPVAGGQKTLIWNYVEDSASFDQYDASLGGITAAADVDFSTDPPWNSLPVSLTWDNIDPTLNWLAFAGASNDRILLLAFGDGEIMVWGWNDTFNRNGQAYISLSESMDFDFDEPDIWKYVDVVVLGLEIFTKTNQTRTLYVQVGQRAGLGTAEDDLTWTAPFPISVSGDISGVVKVNPGGAGRYLRLRLYSQDADVKWAVSSFEIHCRPGGFY